ncbi:MAG: tetratricopeptide repeat protein [Oscillatoriales cyanobacterium SM2_1_8]|nr:tetratricopeptide repeat protein [Oscillatoriales cyanobacterium SM2_1_8]
MNALQVGLSRVQAGDLPGGAAAFREAIAQTPDLAAAHYNLGNVLVSLGDTAGAIAAYIDAIRCEPTLGDAYWNLVNVYWGLGSVTTARVLLERGLAKGSLIPAVGYGLLGDICATEPNGEERAIAAYTQALQLDPGNGETWRNLGIVQARIGRHDAALRALTQATALQPMDGEAWFNLGGVRSDRNEIEMALGCWEQVIALNPLDGRARRQHALALPIVYETEADVERWRQRYTANLAEFGDWARQHPAAALPGLAFATNFLLSYQGQDDRALQSAYGDLVRDVVTQMMPQFSQPLAMPPGPPWRVGYVSSYMYRHTVGKLSVGWVEGSNPESFQVFCYHTGTPQDEITDRFQRSSHRFYHLPGRQWEGIAAQIRQDNLHLLVYLDVGMDPLMTVLAALRLAPVQCVGWGHPVTTGLPTLDFFLSNQEMEPPGGDRHYRETLIRLPGIGLSYRQPLLPPPALPEGLLPPVLLSCQSPFKYLPQDDVLWGEIAARLPQAQLVFVGFAPGSPIAATFQERLNRVMKGDRYRLLPHLPHTDYLALNRAATVFLDVPAWSGGHTVLEAIACGLPVVTWPGSLMRQRHAYGILQTLGVTDTVARDRADYVAKVVRLTADPEYRTQIQGQMTANAARLYNNPQCVQALEDFYREAIAH